MKKLIAILVVVLLLLTFNGCGSNGESSPNGVDQPNNVSTGEEVYSLRLATHYNMEHAGYDACCFIKEELESRSNGRIKVTIYPSSQLGDYTLTFEEMMKGDMDMALTPVATSFDSRLEINFIPFIISEYSQLEKAFGPDSYYQEIYSEVMAELNIKFLGQWVEGFVGIGMSSKPSGDYKDPASTKTELIRVPDNESCRVAVTELGYSTTSIAYADLYTAMQTGVCDGWLGGTPQLNYSDFRDVINYFIPYNFAPENCAIMISMDVYNKLPEDLQTIISDVCAEASLASFSTAEKNDTAALQAMEDYGITILELTPEERQTVADTIWPAEYEFMVNILGKEILDNLIEDIGR